MLKEFRQWTIPENWVWVELNRICLPVEKTNGKSNIPDKEFLYLDINSIDNKINQIVEPKTYKWGDAPSRAQQIVKSGDILFSTVRTYLKNIARVGDEFEKQIASTGFCVIRPFHEINSRLIFYYALTNQFIDPLSAIQRGSSYPAVRNGDVLAQKIPLPPLAEQHRIVAKIEELFSDLDAGIASLKQAQAQLKTYRQAVLKYAFEGKLTAAWREQNPNVKDAFDYLAAIQVDREVKYKSELEQAKRDKTKNPVKDYDFEFQRDKEIPSWAEATLDKLIYIAGRIGWRGLKKEEYTDDGPLFLSVHSLNYGKIVDFREVYHVTDWRYEESPEIKLQENDILLCKDGAGIGKIGIVKNLKERATVNSSLLVIRSREIFLPDFLYHFLNGPELQTVVQSRITGSATPHLFQKDIRRFNLRVPPLEEQHQIVQEIESRLSVCDKLEESLKESLQKAEALRQSILKKAFEGKLAPQDPNDEPAEKLLERIRAEKS